MTKAKETTNAGVYAVIFTSQRTEGDHGYGNMADRMEELAREQPGFVGVESARGEDGFGITISYWESLEAISHWKSNAAHQVAQERGRQDWYEQYEVKVCKVERAYAFGLNR
ncbi:conserved hypothetical protein [Paenibacillus curdlanolyticus YK9]|uniref:ABM domain-containing protein n=1 Tax=Paenibacillus curdlanolyticus YK9 TaxID=717606 RepID=E0IGE7_9BACL|nr:antibiotic biosynthesis monooxygenase [Paenibacillus curdlanolyticus]EFM08447.1 conserved hypothetical protein [Paenibacillus curdlanolyticus YK9]